MKKLFYLLTLFLFMIPISVRADHIYRVDMKIDILEDGTANIEEVWDVKASSGTEWYKTMYELNNSKISNFKVLMDGAELTYKLWNISEGIEQKAGYYGINNTIKGIELCFGKSDMKRHTFTLKYTLSNYVFNTSDSQVLAWVLFPKSNVDKFSAVISSYYPFPDTLDVWGYGYKGYAYVENGLIKISNEDKLSDQYVSLLVKFPINTFKTTNTDSRYGTFNDVYEVAEEGTYDYDYNEGTKKPLFNYLIYILVLLFLSVNIIIFSLFKSNRYKSSIDSTGYGYLDNKTIDKENVPMFRDIPCNKDIYYANTLIKLNNFGYKDSNIFGAIILKWVRNDKIRFKSQKNGNKENNIIDLNTNPTFDNELEEELFTIMYKASKDGMLETEEFETWCSKNYYEFLNLFRHIEEETKKSLESKGLIYKRTNTKECKYENIMSDKIYNDSIQLYGLKKYLEEFSKIDTKEVMEVKLWDEYLMFAYLFGIANKVAKQLKDMYPEVLEQNAVYSSGAFDYNTLLFVSRISTRSVFAATSASRSAATSASRSAAQSYSSGGGGFSSGGGGGFSGGFSGGGGGSAGGR